MNRRRYRPELPPLYCKTVSSCLNNVTNTHVRVSAREPIMLSKLQTRVEAICTGRTRILFAEAVPPWALCVLAYTFRDHDPCPFCSNVGVLEVNAGRWLPSTVKRPHPGPPKRISVLIWYPYNQVSSGICDPAVFHLNVRAAFRKHRVVDIQSGGNVSQEMATFIGYTKG
jgi:hypothetical protein